MSRQPVQARRWMLQLLSVGLALSLAAAGVLGYLVWDLHSRFSKAEDSLNSQLAEAERILDERIAAAQRTLTVIVEGALARAPDVDLVQEQLDDLEETLFGIQGPPPFALDILGDLEKDVAEVSSLKACVNSGFDTLQANIERVESYVAALSTGLIAIRPSTFGPQCL